MGDRRRREVHAGRNRFVSKTGGVAVLLVMLASACGATNTQQDIEFRVPVTAGDVASSTVEDRVVATGTLRAPEMATLTVETTGILRVAKSGGRRLAEGDAVKRGQVVAEVSGEDVTLAARSEATARRLETAQRDYDSKQRLFEEGLITLLDLKNSETTLAEAKNEQERSRLTESRTKLVSPVNGTIIKLVRDAAGQAIVDGQRVMVGTTIAQIAALSTLVADIDLVGGDVARVTPGMTARVRQHAYEGSEFVGRVLRLAPSLDPTTRALRAEVEVVNDQEKLRPGMFVEVTLIADRHENVPVVPRAAVTERAGKKVVFVLKEQSVEQRGVTLGFGDDERVEIREGLKAGERIVVKGIETLADGSKVRVN